MEANAPLMPARVDRDPRHKAEQEVFLLDDGPMGQDLLKSANRG